MPGIARVAADAAGGLFVTALVPTVFVNGKPVVVRGCGIVSHGNSPHNNAVMVGASATVKAGGIPVCRAGDAASCSHIASGSPNVNAG